MNPHTRIPPSDDTATIHHLASLTDGWFDSDGTRIPPHMLTLTAHTLHRIRTRHLPPPQVSAEPDGSIALHWTRQQTCTALYLDNTDTFSLLAVHLDSGDTRHRTVTGLDAALDTVTAPSPASTPR